MRAAMAEEHDRRVAVQPRLVVALEALAAAHNLVDGEAEAVEGVGTVMEAVDSIVEDVEGIEGVEGVADTAVPLAAETVGCYEAVAAVGEPEVVDREAPISGAPVLGLEFAVHAEMEALVSEHCLVFARHRTSAV